MNSQVTLLPHSTTQETYFKGNDTERELEGFRVAGRGANRWVETAKGPPYQADPLRAEREGFEPSVEIISLRRFSKPVVSATHPPLRDSAVTFTGTGGGT